MGNIICYDLTRLKLPPPAGDDAFHGISPGHFFARFTT